MAPRGYVRYRKKVNTKTCKKNLLGFHNHSPLLNMLLACMVEFSLQTIRHYVSFCGPYHETMVIFCNLVIITQFSIVNREKLARRYI